jgi:hypothetical protein
MIELVTKLEFMVAFVNYMEDGGHSHDEWTREWCWKDYQKTPEKYDYLTPFIKGINLT